MERNPVQELIAEARVIRAQIERINDRLDQYEDAALQGRQRDPEVSQQIGE